MTTIFKRMEPQPEIEFEPLDKDNRTWTGCLLHGDDGYIHRDAPFCVGDELQFIGISDEPDKWNKVTSRIVKSITAIKHDGIWCWRIEAE